MNAHETMETNDCLNMSDMKLRVSIMSFSEEFLNAQDRNGVSKKGRFLIQQSSISTAN